MHLKSYNCGTGSLLLFSGFLPNEKSPSSTEEHVGLPRRPHGQREYHFTKKFNDSPYYYIFVLSQMIHMHCFGLHLVNKLVCEFGSFPVVAFMLTLT